jgi:hypothetical protein
VIAGLEQSGREESPDTVVVGSQEPVTKYPSAASRRLQGKRATRLVTPGDGHAGSGHARNYTPELNTWVSGVELSSARCGSVTESATENIPPAEQHGGIAQENLRDVFEKSGLTARAKLNRLARVKRWGKSPPLRWQHRRHGKPRVVQGQIGGESRPGSMSKFAKANALPQRRRKPSQRRTLG